MPEVVEWDEFGQGYDAQGRCVKCICGSTLLQPGSLNEDGSPHYCPADDYDRTNECSVDKATANADNTCMEFDHVITVDDTLEAQLPNGDFLNVTESWAKETRAPSEFTFFQFIESAYDHIGDRDWHRVRVNGRTYGESDLERMYREGRAA